MESFRKQRLDALLLWGGGGKSHSLMQYFWLCGRDQRYVEMKEEG